MILRVVETARACGFDRITAVVGHGRDLLIPCLEAEGIPWVIQERQLGTAHAVSCALTAVGADEYAVLLGDVPLLTPGTVEALMSARRSAGASMAVLTVIAPDPHGYGRIVRGRDGLVSRIVEECDADDRIRSIAEVNTGLMAFDGPSLHRYAGLIGNDNAQGEYYLTDLVALLHGDGLRVDGLAAADPAEVMGINHRADLAAAEAVLQGRIIRHWMLAGVTVHRPDRVWIGPHATFEPDTALWWDVTVSGATRVGPRCELGPGSHLENARLGAGVRVEYSVIRDAEVADGTTVGPYAHIRGGARIGPDNRVGNFVEIKKSTTGAGTKAAHLAYLGDATIGAGVNVGAGTITCNYDGVRKNPTVIGDGAFIGSDSILVAPLTIGAGAYTAAGSAITTDVPPDALAVGRAHQRNIEGWAARRRAKLAGGAASPQPDPKDRKP